MCEYVDAVCRTDVVRPHIRKVARKVQAALAGSLSNGMRRLVSHAYLIILMLNEHKHKM